MKHNISVEEVMKITHKGRDWILNAIERGTFPGSITISSGGRRSAHIPRKAFWDYMEMTMCQWMASTWRKPPDVL